MINYSEPMTDALIEKVGEAIARQMAEDANDNASLARAALAATPIEEMVEALREAEREFRRIASPHTHQSCLWAGFADRCAAALRKVNP